MVETIIEAAARTLAEEGYARATTNRIAQAAGVSVGSLYQYFPSKDAIAVELARRLRASRLALVAERLRGAGEKPLEVVVPELLRAVLRAEGINPELYRVLVDSVVRPNPRRELLEYARRLETMVVEALRAARPALAIVDYELTAFILVRSVLALVHAASADEPRFNTPVLVDELATLILGYLRPHQSEKSFVKKSVPPGS
jgi:AcrR family transcriptional regulator